MDLLQRPLTFAFFQADLTDLNMGLLLPVEPFDSDKGGKAGAGEVQECESELLED